MIDEEIFCSDCGSPLIDDKPMDDLSQRKPCPHCGSLKRTHHASILETLTVRDYYKMVAKRRGKKRPIFELESGSKRSIALDKRVHLERNIDRENDLYVERITDYETGEIIHECEEPLSKHMGHGADKMKNKKK
jgi:hypothetical protein